ncbi:YgdI/YgdR family lipoprotein [Aeromonas veronii]
MKKLMMILVCALGLVACSSQYIMSTKDGKMIANSTSKCDTRLCRLTVLFEYLDRLPESETFPRS